MLRVSRVGSNARSCGTFLPPTRSTNLTAAIPIANAVSGRLASIDCAELCNPRNKRHVKSVTSDDS